MVARQVDLSRVEAGLDRDGTEPGGAEVDTIPIQVAPRYLGLGEGGTKVSEYTPVSAREIQDRLQITGFFLGRNQSSLDDTQGVSTDPEIMLLVAGEHFVVRRDGTVTIDRNQHV